MSKTIYRSDPYTFIKHRAYEYYLNCWLPVFLSKRPLATIVDCFAGAGVYSDGEPGSSVVAAKTLLQHSRLPSLRGKLRVLSLEEREDRAAELDRQLGKLQRHPKLEYEVLEPGDFSTQAQRLQAYSHRGGRGPEDPVLWLMDPYGPADLNARVVEDCMQAGRRDEAIITFFAREMHRKRTVPAWQIGMGRHFGDDSWRSALEHSDQKAGMDELVARYCAGWEAKGLHSGRFAVRLASESARYFLVFLTHSIHGLDCWTKMVSRMDPVSSEGASPVTARQPSLFDGDVDTTRIRAALGAFEGQERPWDDLRVATLKVGQTEKGLRRALGELRETGRAFRVRPLESESRTPWPEGCSVRFYSEDDLRFAEQTEDD